MYTLAEALVYNYNNHLGIIDDGQLDDEIFKSWCAATIGIYKKVKIIKKDRSWLNLSDIKQLPETSEIYSFVSEILGMIGPVNDFPLRRENDLGGLFVAFASAPRRAEEKELIPNGNNRTLFRLRLERYFARLIVEQSLKPKRLLEDELEDLRSVRRLKSQRRKKALLEQENQSTAPPPDEAELIHKLIFTSVLVRCNTYAAHTHSSIQKLTATVDIANLTDGAYKWEVEVEGESRKAIQEFVALQYYHPRGVDVDNNMESENFGDIYVTEGMPHLFAMK